MLFKHFLLTLVDFNVFLKVFSQVWIVITKLYFLINNILKNVQVFKTLQSTCYV